MASLIKNEYGVLVYDGGASYKEYQLSENDLEWSDGHKHIFKIPQKGDMINTLTVQGRGVEKAVLYQQQKLKRITLDEVFSKGPMEPFMLSGFPVNDALYVEARGDAVNITVEYYDLSDDARKLLHAKDVALMHTSYPYNTRTLNLDKSGRLMVPCKP